MTDAAHTAHTAPAAASQPGYARLALIMLVSGACATVAFDLFGQALSPLFGYAKLAPVPLATQSWAVLTGVKSVAMGHLLHYIAGLIAYPLGWLILRVALARVEGAIPLPRPALLTLAAAAYGVALWVFALWFMASLIAGNPPFLGFTGITWVALIGHVLFAAISAIVAERMIRSPRPDA